MYFKPYFQRCSLVLIARLVTLICGRLLKINSSSSSSLAMRWNTRRFLNNIKSWANMKCQSTNRTLSCKPNKPSYVTDLVFFRKMTSGDVGGNTHTHTHKPLPYFIWTTAFTAVAESMAAPTATVCFLLKSHNVHPWDGLNNPGGMHTCPLTTFSHSAPSVSFELLYPCGCTHPLSSRHCATTFLPDQFQAQMSTDKAEEKRACGRNMAAITNTKTSGEGGSLS